MRQAPEQRGMEKRYLCRGRRLEAPAQPPEGREVRNTVRNLLDEIERRVSAIEKFRGWNRYLGWDQVDGQGQEVLYEFGRFAQLVDLLEEFER